MVKGSWQPPEGFHMAKLYPVEGDSAIAELWIDGDVWAQIELEGINLDTLGNARTEGAAFKVMLFPPPRGSKPGWWEFDLADLEMQLSKAKEWLIENERGREPLADGGFTAAGRATEKLGGCE